VKVKIFLVIVSLFFHKSWIQAQNLIQNLEGFVFNEANNEPLSQITVYLISSDLPLDSITTNQAGYFIFNDLEVGRYDVSFIDAAYEPIIKPAILLSTSKPTFLEIYLKKRFTVLNEITIIPEKNKVQAFNSMSTLSTISLQPEDARKFAGGLDDPIRAAANLAGIHSNGSFSDNFISIRGNAPRALKYYFEGIELPNPTHFARIGSAGGTFTIFSLQLLGNSALFTGAFPAEYGNSSAGIFDVNFRNGNNQNHEFGFQVGTLGIDVSAEGPLQKGKKASYLANFRYATVGLARLIGYPTQPTYTDFSFNLNFPLSDIENLKVFSISGASDRIRTAIKEVDLWEEGLDRYELVLNSKLFSLGATYSKLFRPNTVFKASMFGGFTQQQDNRIFLLYNLQEIKRSINEYESMPVSLALSAKHSYSSRFAVQAGLSANYTNHHYTFFQTNDTIQQPITNQHIKGNSFTTKVYLQSNYSLTEKIVLNTGLHFLHHSVNGDFFAEPRLGIRYQFHPKHSVAFAYGKHGQVEEYAVYQYKSQDLRQTNSHLKATKSHHFTLAYQGAIHSNHLLTIEAYYQHLYDVPVEPEGTFSTLNLSELNDIRILNNSGKGKNYGIDAGFKRFTDKGLYYQLNASWLNSIYLAGDDIWRSTEFDFGYNIKLLLGKEISVGKKKGKRNLLSFNGSLSAIGGKPYTPLNLTESARLQNSIFNESLAFSKREEGLIVLDLTTIYQTNKAKRSAIWTFQIKNLFSSADAVYREYDTILDEEVIVPSSSFFPVISYGLAF